MLPCCIVPMATYRERRPAENNLAAHEMGGSLTRPARTTQHEAGLGPWFRVSLTPRRFIGLSKVHTEP